MALLKLPEVSQSPRSFHPAFCLPLLYSGSDFLESMVNPVMCSNPPLGANFKVNLKKKSSLILLFEYVKQCNSKGNTYNTKQTKTRRIFR